MAGAEILPLPHHLGLGGCVQAGYKLAFELGYDYVIRLDGDGQHDPKYIPALLDVLRKTGCDVVIPHKQKPDGTQTYGDIVFVATDTAESRKTIWQKPRQCLTC